MARPTGSKTVYFSSVKEAREALRAKAMELIDGYMELISEARASQELEVAAEGYQFLLKHLPKDEAGVSLLDTTVDFAGGKEASGPKGPTIQIGIALGGVKPKELAPAVIDVEPNDSDH
jgi:hypothetical protein